MTNKMFPEPCLVMIHLVQFGKYYSRKDYENISFCKNDTHHNLHLLERVKTVDKYMTRLTWANCQPL